MTQAGGTEDAVGAARLGRQPGLDGLRGIAALLVLLTHATSWLWQGGRPWLAEGGVLGVHLFFVLSGFLITVLLLQERDRRGRVDIVGFAERRARRLVPALAALLAVLGLRAVVDHTILFSTVVTSAGYVLTFTANVAQISDHVPLLSTVLDDIGTYDGVRLTHIWSVAVEAHFYALWGLCLWAATRRRWSHERIAVLAGVLALGVALWRAVELSSQGRSAWVALYVQTHARLDAPLIGALAGAAFCAGWLDRVPRQLLARAGAVGFAAVMVGAFVLTIPDLADAGGVLNVVVAVGSALAVAAVVVVPTSPIGTVLAVRPLRFLGTISYSLYVWHPLVYELLARSAPGWLPAGPGRLAVGILLTLPVSWASYRFVEKPFLRRRSRRVVVTATDAPTTDALTADAAQAEGNPAPIPS